MTVHRKEGTDLDVGVIVFIWLGSDNSKGMATEWKQGFKAIGRVTAVARGAKYNDESTTEVEVFYVFPNAINRLDILRDAAADYYFDEWHQNNYIAIGWNELGDLTAAYQEDADSKTIIMDALKGQWNYDNRLASRKYGEINSFYSAVADTTYAVAMAGQKVLAIGVVTGGYFFDEEKDYGHCRPVRWLKVFDEAKTLPVEGEGKLTTFYELKNSENICYLRNANPSIVGVVVTVVLGTIKNSINVAAGKMTATEMGMQFVDTLVVSSGYLVSMKIGGIIAQALFPELPGIGYAIGSLLGCSLAVVYNIGKNKLISFCIDTGFTCFGLVEQSYELPDEVLKEMGIDTVNIGRAKVKTSTVSRTQPTANIGRASYETIDITVLRRGVIGVNKIGYVV